MMWNIRPSSSLSSVRDCGQNRFQGFDAAELSVSLQRTRVRFSATASSHCISQLLTILNVSLEMETAH